MEATKTNPADLTETTITRRGYAFRLCPDTRATGYPYVLRRAATDKTPEVARLMGTLDEAEAWAETIADMYAVIHGEGVDAQAERDAAREDAFLACHPAN